MVRRAHEVLDVLPIFRAEPRSYLASGLSLLGEAPDRSQQLRSVAIDAYTEEPQAGEELIAHVHPSNMLPRKLLTGIGFVDTGTAEDVPDHLAPPAMPKINGKLSGDLFRFDWARCDAHAGELERVIREKRLGDAMVYLGFSALNDADGREAFIQQLRAIGQQHRT